MADYFEAHGYNLLSQSTDADGDAIAVKKIGTTLGGVAVPASYPATYDLDIGQIIIENDAGDFFVRLASDASNPDAGATAAAGTIYFTVVDEHGAESANTATATINLEGDTGGAVPDYVATGLVERWAADAGVTLSGSDVTDWLGQESGLNLDAIGTPTVGTPIGGTAGATIVIGPDEGMTGTTLTGLPVGASSRTVQMLWKPTGGFGYAGFGWGTNTTDGAFTLSVDGSDEIALDTFNNRVNIPIHPADQWLTLTVTYDGTTAEVWLGDVLVGSAARDLTTGSSLINLCRTFSARTTEAEIGEILVYGRVLSAAEIQANVAYLNGRYIGSSAMGAPDEAIGSAIAETSFRASAPANIPFCVAAWSARASSTPATETEILAGTGAVDFGIAFVDGDGNIVADITGAAASTDYYVNWITYGLTGGKSAVVTSAAITTATTPVANPVLSAAAMTATGQTTATGQVTTDVGNGTLFYGLMLQGATTPNATQLKAGTDGDGNPLIGGLRTKPITAVGVQNVSFTALTAAIAYKDAYYQEDGSGNPSNIVTATATTDAVTAPTTSLSPDATAATAAGVYAILDGWEADWNGTTPSGKTNADMRVVQLTAPVAGSMTITNDFSAYPGVIFRGVGPYGEHGSYPYYPTCGSHVSGTITVSGSANVQVRLITCARLLIQNNSGVVSAYDVSVNSRLPSRQTPTVQLGVETINSPGVIVNGCHVAGFRTCSISIGPSCHDASIEENYCEQFSDDLIKCRHGSGVLNRPVRRRNWMGRDNLSPTGAHSDIFQDQDGTINDPIVWGNVAIEGSSLNGISFQGGYFQSTLNQSPGAIAKENIFCMRGTNAITALGGAGTNECSDNTLLYSEFGDHGSVQPYGLYAAPTISNGWAVKERNAVCRLNSGSADTSGTDGDVFTIGNVFKSNIVVDTSRYPLYWEGFPGENRYIAEVKPKVGTRAHWDYPGTTRFAAQRSKEIWVDGLHPGNRGWPTAAAWHREYDPANTTGSSWTGSYDADGKNASVSPTSVTIADPALTVYDSDPHGVDAARITFTGTHNQDGSTLQIRVYDPSDDSDVVGWTDFTAGASGTWSKSLDVPRGWNACRAEVRAKFSTGVNDQQGADFYSGYIWALYGDSLAARPLTAAASTASLIPPDDTLWVLFNNVNGSVNAGPIKVTNSSILNLRRMACAVAEYSDAPMMIVDLTQAGTSLGQTVDANETTNRSWTATVQAPVDYIQSRGSDVSILLYHGTGNDAGVQLEMERHCAPAFLKQTWNGQGDTPDGSGLAPYTGGSVTVVPSRAYTPVHYFWDINGTGLGLFDESRTKLASWAAAAFVNPTGTNGSYAANDIQKARVLQSLRDAMDGTPFGQISFAAIPGWAGQTWLGSHMAAPEGTHVNEDAGETDGEALVAVYMAIAACRAVGAMIPKEPQVIGVTDSGTYWDVEISLPHGGNLSTSLIEHGAGSYAGSFEAANWTAPTDLDEGDIAQLHEVQGFAVWTGGSADWTNFTAVIQDTGTGTVPSRSGVIRVTPNGGSTVGKTLTFGLYDGVNLLSVGDIKSSRVETHWPLETRTHVTGTGYGFPVVRQSGETIIVAIT